MSWLESFDPGVSSGILLVLLCVAGELGGRLGAALPPSAGVRDEVGALQAAILGLLGLLLAFSFSMAADRFEARRLLVVEESNAIGTAWLRSAALPEPARDEVRGLLRDYVEARLEFYAAGDDDARIRAAISRAEGLQRAFWGRSMAEAVATPGSLPLQLQLQALNAVIDVHAQRVTALRGRVPQRILELLFAVSLVGLGVVGIEIGLGSRRHRVPVGVLATLLAGIVYVILDLDHPRRGHIRVSQQSMEDLRDDLASQGR